MKDLKLGKDFVVTLHNDLVEARLLDSMTINEQKILYAVLSNIEPPEFKKDEKGKRTIVNKIQEIEPFRVPIKDFTEWLGITDPNYAAFKKTVKKLMRRLIEIQQQDGSWQIFQWITKAQYIAKTGTAEIKISPELYPYLINLENNFTQTKLNTLLSFKSRYTIRLYQLMKKWSKIGKWRVELEDLRSLLGIPIDKLTRYAQFKEKALMVAVNEINSSTNTEFNLNITEHKRIRKVSAITFEINLHNKEQIDIRNKPIVPNEGKEQDYYGKNLIENYDYRDYSVYDKESGDMVLLDGLERVQLIIYNRKLNSNFNFSDKACSLLEKELMKVVHLSDFNISEQTSFIFSYTNYAKTRGLNNPEGFIIKKTKELVEKLLQGEKATYRDLFDTNGFRLELLPDWMYKGEQSKRQSTPNNPNQLVPESNLTLEQAQLIQLKLKLNREKELLEKDEDLYEEYKRLDEKYGIDVLIANKEKVLDEAI